VLDLVRQRAGTVFSMRQLAEDSGGRAFTPADMKGVGPVYDAIAAELGQQYWLAYAPAPSEKYGFRRVSVRVESRGGLRVRTRSGYYVPEGPARSTGTTGTRR
jgi:hypothetical protein